ncbi:hypothetical protein SAY87_029814 [Trapa incisa]|uniref:peptidylprolyl isomerase n=1 Tax=Trapa incisa TaxID=236973 RepID=A0AAN7QDL5_9MYRT|nr:hypothetical protein SAY87_029814 [Trapa incisa]
MERIIKSHVKGCAVPEAGLQISGGSLSENPLGDDIDDETSEERSPLIREDSASLQYIADMHLIMSSESLLGVFGTWSDVQDNLKVMIVTGSSFKRMHGNNLLETCLRHLEHLRPTSTESSGKVSESLRVQLRASKIPEDEFTALPNGLKYYDVKVGGGAEAVKGSRVAVHYVAKWKGITFMTSRQGLGVGGGTPYGFDVGQSERGNVLKGLDLGVQGMRVGGQRLLIVPPELAYGSKGVQEIPPNATIELDVELLSIKQSPFGTPVKIVEG